jgi:hypothetical protein
VIICSAQAIIATQLQNHDSRLELRYRVDARYPATGGVPADAGVHDTVVVDFLLQEIRIAEPGVHPVSRRQAIAKRHNDGPVIGFAGDRNNGAASRLGARRFLGLLLSAAY